MASASFPSAIKTWTEKVNGVDSVDSAHINEAFAEIIAIENYLKTPSRSTPTTETKQIISLPSTAIKGSRLDVTVSGNTVTNILPDDVAGCESTAPFGAGSCTIATDSSNEIEGTNCIKATLTATTEAFVRYSMLSLLDSSKYYLITAHVKNGNLSGLGIRLQFNSDDTDITGSYVTSTAYSRLGVVVQPSNFDTASFAYLKLLLSGSSTQYAHIDALMLQEITSEEYALGASALLTKYAYHRGTKSSDKMRILVEGKNTLNPSYGSLTASGVTINVDTDGTITLNGTASANIFFKLTGGLATAATISQPTWLAQSSIGVEGGSTYALSTTVVSGSTSGSLTYALRSQDDAATLSQSGTSATGTLSYSKYPFAYISITSGRVLTNYKTRLQLEKNSVATTWEQYSATSSIVPVELKSISDDIKDEFDCNTGEETQNTEKQTVSLAGATKVITNNAGRDVWRINPFTFTSVAYNWVNSNLTSHTLLSVSKGKLSQKVLWTDVTSVGWAIYANGLDLVVPTGEDPATYFGELTLFYQLATPVPTNYLLSILTAEPGGRIVATPFDYGFDVYNGGFIVNDVNEPMRSLINVYKVSLETGLPITPISISTCTVAADGLSATSTALANGDPVYFEFDPLNARPNLDVTYSFGLNEVAAIEDNGKQIRDLDEKIEQLTMLERLRLKTASVPLGAIAATASQLAFIAPFACDLVNIKIVTKDAIAASDADYWTIAAVDKGSAGSDSNTIASKTTKVTGGTAFAAYDAWDIGTLDNTHSKLAAGDVVLLSFTKTGNPTAFAEAFAMISYIVAE